MNKTRHSLLLILSIVPLAALADSRVVPEDVLAEWGYHTTHLEEQQTIRQVESLPGREQPMHPRFNIWSECFDSNDAALRRMAAKEAEIDAERSIIYKSGVGMLVRNECVYFVSAHGTFFMLEFQPFIMRKLEEHLCPDQECTRSTQLDDL
ncbi:MAG: hypothetical protein QNI99_09330 [Woeseiaceae bacterium]|nr:hypothetical protein [Woeseiaceae bacterium]